MNLFADRSKNLPVGKVITLTNLANGEQVWANPHGMLHHVAPGNKAFGGWDVVSAYMTGDRGEWLLNLQMVPASSL